MDGFGSRLAARFRKAVEREETGRRREEELRQRAIDEGRAARDALLKDLAATGRAIGVLRVTVDEAGVILAYGERKLQFLRDGDGERVKVAFDGMAEGEEHWLYRQPELGHRWVYGRRKRPRDDRFPLFDQGLEELLVKVLGLPKPGEDDLDDPPPGAGRKL